MPTLKRAGIALSARSVAQCVWRRRMVYGDLLAPDQVLTKQKG